MITNSSKPKVIAVVGPTASGKTAYAINLAKEINGEIVSADSRLVYKGLDIGTAKPTSEEQAIVPHHLIDIVDPEFEYSAGLYAKDAKNAIYDILSRGKTPIVAGGTGLYINVLLQNYSLPEVNPDYELRESLREKNGEALKEILSEFDAETAALIETNDRKKLIRAIEIVKTHKKTMRELRGINEPDFNVDWIGLNMPREELYERINSRVDLMIEFGLIDETKAILKKHGRINNLLYTIGYQEIIGYLDEEMTLDEAKEKLKQNTRRYAKRQLTWFRRNQDIKWNFYPEKLKA